MSAEARWWRALTQITAITLTSDVLILSGSEIELRFATANEAPSRSHALEGDAAASECVNCHSQGVPFSDTSLEILGQLHEQMIAEDLQLVAARLVSASGVSSVYSGWVTLDAVPTSVLWPNDGQVPNSIDWSRPRLQLSIATEVEDVLRWSLPVDVWIVVDNKEHVLALTRLVDGPVTEKPRASPLFLGAAVAALRDSDVSKDSCPSSGRSTTAEEALISCLDELGGPESG
jgi:hypothetical protein